MPLILDWNDGGKKVSVTGTFTGWRKRVTLRKTYFQQDGKSVMIGMEDFQQFSKFDQEHIDFIS